MKNKLRRLQTFLLCVILLALLIPPATASALGPGEEFLVGEFVFQINEDGATVMLIRFEGENHTHRALSIPPSIIGPDRKSYAVTKIGPRFFEMGQSLEFVYIPQGITEIGEYSFAFCPSLREITFDPGMTSLTTIGNGAFQDAQLDSNTSLRLPYGVTSIGENAFMRGFPSGIIIPDTLTYVGSPEDSMLNRSPVWLEVGKNTEIIAPGTGFRVSTAAVPDAQIQVRGVELRHGGKVTNHGDGFLSVRLPDGTEMALAPGDSFALPPREGADVKLTYIPSVDGGTIYNVDVAWGSLEFTYNEGGPGVWNPDTHQYDGAAEQDWSADDENGDLITVTNHSNKGIVAEFIYHAKTGYETIAGALTGDAITTGQATLPTAEKTLPENAPAVTAKLTLSGSVSNTMPTTQTAIGTVTVIIL